ncbi:DNA (cytosine-5-)-methyltransferase [Hoyosella rhizosphaerae]|uniref:Cytosine-specific methyltransferase n=1 Tax=Hoyosella rhizosphaerae TaxID=1755582 RepID=A0A916XDD9_9ACTN|nr:DNA (cytosine-5-)-methyltransferase [Hoyosella rhizosphaerae]MBN4927696.1 DNA (cytosine-5-)-methyltransferase [Hoyosella rhizosphaerae]GGC62395.1 cytosine-specific methyltransferase [Hoyosella rhizosphaerae]
MIPGSELRQRRKNIGISQYQFAQRVGITSATLSAWELNKKSPSPAVHTAVSTALRELEAHKVAGAFHPNKRRTNGKAGKKPPPHVGGSHRVVPNLEQTGPTVLAAFSGCGGMAEGFRAAGCSIQAYVDSNSDARDTFARNFPGARSIGTDITTIQPAEVEDQLRGTGLGGTHIDILAGGPPCQGFSLAGKRNHDDPRNQLFNHLLSLADVVQPRVIVMENVRLLLSMKDPNGTYVIDRIIDSMTQRGYTATVNPVNAQDYGVPQHRERIFIIATRVNPIHFPPASHGSNLMPHRTFRDATADLPPLEAGQACPNDPLHWAVDHPEHVLSWLRDVPEGKSAHDNADPALRPPSGYNTTYKRLRWDEPASTIGTTFGMISASRNVHPQYTRSLTIREAMRLQTIPDDYQFAGTWGAIRTMIGNAVPPQLALTLARHVIPQL